MQRINRSNSGPFVQMLQLPLNGFMSGGIEQIAQLGVSKELAQLGLVDGERLRAPFGQRSIPVVDVVRNVAKQQRGGNGDGARESSAITRIVCAETFRSVSTSAGISKWSRRISR